MHEIFVPPFHAKVRKRGSALTIKVELSSKILQFSFLQKMNAAEQIFHHIQELEVCALVSRVFELDTPGGFSCGEPTPIRPCLCPLSDIARMYAEWKSTDSRKRKPDTLTPKLP